MPTTLESSTGTTPTVLAASIHFAFLRLTVGILAAHITNREVRGHGYLPFSLARSNPFYPASDYFFGDRLGPYFRKQLLGFNEDPDSHIFIHDTIPYSHFEDLRVFSPGETLDEFHKRLEYWKRSLQAACDCRPGAATFRLSCPLLDTAYVKPWSRVRNASDLFDEYDKWDGGLDSDAPLFIWQPHSAVKVSREDDFRITEPLPCRSFIGPGPRPPENFSGNNPTPVVMIGDVPVLRDLYHRDWSSEFVPKHTSKHKDQRDRDEFFEPTEEQLTRWRKKYTTTTDDGKAVFKKPDERERGLCRFQSISHENYTFKHIGDKPAPYASEDGLYVDDDEQIQREDPDEKVEDKKEIHLSGGFAESPMPLQVRSRKLDQLIEDYNKHTQVEAPHTRLLSLKRFRRINQTSHVGELFTEKVAPGTKNAGPTKQETDWWEKRLASAFQLDFEKQRKYADTEFEHWRREAEKLKNDEDFNHWYDVLKESRPPSWGMIRSAYRPEPRGKFYVVDADDTEAIFDERHWFDYVYDGPKIEKLPDKKAMREFINNKPEKKRRKCSWLMTFIYNPERKHAVAREKGIKMKSIDRDIQRLKKEFEEHQQNGGRLFDARKLSPKDLHQILEYGGSYIVLPGERKDVIDIHRIDVDPAKLTRIGLLAGLSGHDSEDEWLGGLQMQMFKDIVAEIDQRKLTTGKRNRAISAARKRLDERFTAAEVHHFGEPEAFREQIRDQMNLKKDEENL